MLRFPPWHLSQGQQPTHPKIPVRQAKMLISPILLATLTALPTVAIPAPARSPEHARRWFIGWEAADRPAMYCDRPADDAANFGASSDAERPLYQDCWDLGISLSLNPRRYTVGDWRGTHGCGQVGSNGTCGVCVGRLDGRDDEVV